jgi:hypothetical protein
LLQFRRNTHWTWTLAFFPSIQHELDARVFVGGLEIPFLSRVVDYSFSQNFLRKKLILPKTRTRWFIKLATQPPYPWDVTKEEELFNVVPRPPSPISQRRRQRAKAKDNNTVPAGHAPLAPAASMSGATSSNTPANAAKAGSGRGPFQGRRRSGSAPLPVHIILGAGANAGGAGYTGNPHQAGPVLALNGNAGIVSDATVPEPNQQQKRRWRFWRKEAPYPASDGSFWLPFPCVLLVSPV